MMYKLRWSLKLMPAFVCSHSLYLNTTFCYRKRYGMDNVVLSDIMKPTRKILADGEYHTTIIPLYISINLRFNNYCTVEPR